MYYGRNNNSQIKTLNGTDMSKNFSCPGRDFFIETFLLGLLVCIPAEERMEMCSTMSVITRTVKIVKKYAQRIMIT